MPCTDKICATRVILKICYINTNSFQEEAPINIVVLDSNTDDKTNVLIDHFYVTYNSTKAGFNQTSTTADNFNLIGTRSNNPTR